MPSSRLFELLADAEARPSGAFQDLQAATGAATNIIDSVEKGQKKARQKRTLEQILGGPVPEGLEGFKNVTQEDLTNIAKPVEDVASVYKAVQGEPIFLTEEQSKMTGGAFAPNTRVTQKAFIDAINANKKRTQSPEKNPQIEVLQHAIDAIDARERSIDANFGMGDDPAERESRRTNRARLVEELRKASNLPPTPKPPTPPPVVGDADKVIVVDKNGKEFKLPKSQLKEAQAQGYRLK